MLLVADVGNTNTKIGVFDGPRLVNSWRMTSRREQTADEYGLVIETFLQTRGIPVAAIHGIAISNVVPPVQQTLEWMGEQYFGRTAFFVEPGVQLATMLPLTNMWVGAAYDPARWRDRSLHHDVRVTTFGHGSHRCPAQRFSVSAIVRAVARLHETFELTPRFATVEPLPRQIGGVARTAAPCPVDYSRHRGNHTARR